MVEFVELKGEMFHQHSAADGDELELAWSNKHTRVTYIYVYEPTKVNNFFLMLNIYLY
jgi:hypothetical protein